VFLRRVVPVGANKSYGIDVARLAGLPKHVIGRSREIMSKLEGGGALAASSQLSLIAAPGNRISSLADNRSGTLAEPSPAIARIAATDIDRMTPLEALQLLAELKKLL
jgi:DNA mismatch repair protein MutS